MLVIIDLETGGVQDYHPDIQIAAIALDGSLAEVDALEMKLEFLERDCDPKALEINSYDPVVWKEQRIPEVRAVKRLGDFLRKHADMKRTSARTGAAYYVARVGGHNFARFDGPRLDRMFKRHGAFLPADIYRPLDTLQLALWSEYQRGIASDSYKLGDVCARLGIECSAAHDALGDVRMCAELIRRLTPRQED